MSRDNVRVSSRLSQKYLSGIIGDRKKGFKGVFAWAIVVVLTMGKDTEIF